MTQDIDNSKIIEDFYKYYCFDCLTHEEKQNIPILSIDFFKIFRN